MEPRGNLVLLGFMGTGKSAVGRRVAALAPDEAHAGAHHGKEEEVQDDDEDDAPNKEDEVDH